MISEYAKLQVHLERRSYNAALTCFRDPARLWHGRLSVSQDLNGSWWLRGCRVDGEEIQVEIRADSLTGAESVLQVVADGMERMEDERRLRPIRMEYVAALATPQPDGTKAP